MSYSRDFLFNDDTHFQTVPNCSKTNTCICPGQQNYLITVFHIYKMTVSIYKNDELIYEYQHRSKFRFQNI